MTPPAVPFLSLFVDDLPAAARRYQALLGIPPTAGARGVPGPHPFAAGDPVVFELGAIALALYAAAPARGTHPGDVGIGLSLDRSADELAAALRDADARLVGPVVALDDGRALAVAMLPDRHFLEIVVADE